MQREVNSECKTLTYISLVLTILGLVVVAICITDSQNYAEDACSPMQ